jgi:hypothetical protein
MRTLFILATLLGSCYPVMVPNSTNNGAYNGGYNNGENQPTSEPSAYPNNNNGGYGITTNPQPSEGGYGISTPNLGPNATYSCEAKCNDSKIAVTCQGGEQCNAWCDDYNAPHAECK